MFWNRGIADEDVIFFFEVAKICTGFVVTLALFSGLIKLVKTKDICTGIDLSGDCFHHMTVLIFQKHLQQQMIMIDTTSKYNNTGGNMPE